MFDLEINIDIWKTSIEKSDNLTEDDILELESHIRDKIEDLISRGNSEEKSFNIAISEIGSADLINDEYKKVNINFTLMQKLTYGALGYIGIYFIMECINILTILILAPFSDLLLKSDTIYVPIINNLLKVLYNENMVNNLSIFGILVYGILGIGAIYLILSNKISLLCTLIKSIETYKENKLANIFLLMILPILLVVLPISIKLGIYKLIQYNELSTLITTSLLMSFIFNIVLVGCFTLDISKSDNENKHKTVALSGYIAIQFIFSLIEKISISILVILKAGKYILPTIIVISLIIIASLIFAIYKVKITLNRKDKILLGVLGIGVVIVSEVLLLPIIYSSTSRALLVNSELIMIIYLLKYLLGVLTPIIYSVVLLKSSFNNSKKLLKVRR